MGIPKLNRYLTDNCKKESIKKIHLSELSGKILAIDVSIYLYKFLNQGDLIENMYLFISILKKYDIVPIFIFDGKPPPEKKNILIKRNKEKKDAEIEYKQLEDDIIKKKFTKEELAEINKKIECLKKKSIKIKNSDIINVKKLMTLYGVQYYDAIQEADQLCGIISKRNDVFGCVSDDMDMFMYECKYIIRHISLINHTAIIYNCEDIYKDLNINYNELLQILLISTSDYNINNKLSIKESFEILYKYKNNNNTNTLYEYINETEDIVIDNDLIIRIKNIILCDSEYCDFKFNLNNNNKNLNELKVYLKDYGFYWVN